MNAEALREKARKIREFADPNNPNSTINLALKQVLQMDEVVEYATKLQEEQLYDRQIDSNGNSMPPYAPKTRRRKPCANYNLYASGDLYRSFELWMDGTRIVVGPGRNQPPYATKYDYAYGLTKESIALLREFIQPFLKAKINELLA